MSLLRMPLSAAFALVGLLAASPALAATLTIEQQSPGSSYGEWRLQTPEGTTISSFHREQLRTISNATPGDYVLTVHTPPRDAQTSITHVDAGHAQGTTQGERLAFTVGSGSARIIIHYSYEGTIRVESVPSKATFELSGPSGMRYTGVTPAEFTNLPPVYYTVNFGRIDGCNLPRTQKRLLSANETVTVTGKYVCGDDRFATSSSASNSSQSISSSTSSAPRSASASSRPVGALSLWQSAHQGEVLPDGTVRFTVGVRNRTQQSVDGITVTQQFDSTTLLPVLPLAEGGYVQGDVIVWNIAHLPAGRSWSAHTTFTVAASAKQGDRITINARASAQDAPGIFIIGNLAADTIVGVTTLPPTGFASDLLATILFLAGAAGMTALYRRRI